MEHVQIDGDPSLQDLWHNSQHVYEPYNNKWSHNVQNEPKSDTTEWRTFYVKQQCVSLLKCPWTALESNSSRVKFSITSVRLVTEAFKALKVNVCTEVSVCTSKHTPGRQLGMRKFRKILKLLFEKCLHTLSVKHVVMFSPHVKPSRPVLHHHERFLRLHATHACFTLMVNGRAGSQKMLF